MYQCQMGKQTMGTPYHTYHRFSENKLYRLYFPGTPFFRPVHYDYLKLDDYPSGTNAVVAVISYTVSLSLQDCNPRELLIIFSIRDMIWKMQ